MKKLVFNKKGMTLTELLVGIVIFSLVFAVLTTMFMSTLSVYTKSNDAAEYNTLLDNTANRILGDLSASTQTPVIAGSSIFITAGSVNIKYSIDGGVLYKSVNGAEAGAVFDKAYYRDKSVTIVGGSPDGGKTVNLTVTVSSDSGGMSVSREYTVRPLVLNQY